jgi:tetratricopeptide (TPR) repeat protein
VAESAGAGPAGGRPGLGEADEAALEQVFAVVASEMGFDGGAVAGRLRAGEPLAAALDLPGGTLDLLYARAHASFNAGRMIEAERLFRALTLLDGNGFDYWLGYGICLRLRDRFETARDVFAIAAALRPASAAPYFHLLEACLVSGDLAGARAAVRACETRRFEGLGVSARGEFDRLLSALSLREQMAAGGGG